MKGYAVEIKLLEWQKPDDQGTDFKQLKSHYVGSFSKETSERAYGKLDKLLDQLSVKRRPTEATNRKRS